MRATVVGCLKRQTTVQSSPPPRGQCFTTVHGTFHANRIGGLVLALFSLRNKTVFGTHITHPSRYNVWSRGQGGDNRSPPAVFTRTCVSILTRLATRTGSRSDAFPVWNETRGSMYRFRMRRCRAMRLTPYVCMRITRDFTGSGGGERERFTAPTGNVHGERGYGHVVGGTPRRPRTPCARETAGRDNPVYPITSDRRMRRRETTITSRRPSHVHPGWRAEQTRRSRAALPDKEITTRPVRDRRDNGTLDDLVRLPPSAAERAAVLARTYHGPQAGVANFC